MDQNGSARNVSSRTVSCFARQLAGAATALMLGLGLLLAGVAGAGAQMRLTDNVFFVPDPTARSVEFQMVVRAGCSDEANNDCRGLAHYLEHLILIGRNADNASTGLLFFADGYSNGWTSNRATAYIHRFPARQGEAIADLEKLFAFYINRLQDFEVSAADAERERRVVRQEHDQRVASNPFSPFYKDLQAKLIPDHPLGQWPIGTPESIAAMTVEEAKAFHQRWYSRDNVAFIVQGNLDPAAVKALAEKYTPQMPVRPVPERAWMSGPTLEPASLVFRQQKPDVKQLNVSIDRVLRVPEAEGPFGNDPVRLILGQFLASKLPGSPHSELVERQGIANEVSVSLSKLSPGFYQLRLGAQPDGDETPEMLQQALERYWQEFLARGVDASAVERLKRRSAEAWRLDAREPRRLTQRVVDWFTRPQPFELLEKWPGAVAAVTPEDVNSFVRKLDAPIRQVVGILEPGA